MLRRAQKRGEATLIAHQLFTDGSRGRSAAENRPKASGPRADTHVQVGYWVVAQNRLVERTIELRLRVSVVLFSLGKGRKVLAPRSNRKSSNQGWRRFCVDFPQ
jgi:hypothetical protein